MNTKTETSKTYKMFDRHATLSSMEFRFLFSTNERIRDILIDWVKDPFHHPINNQMNGLYDGYFYFTAIKNLNKLQDDLKKLVGIQNKLAERGKAERLYFPTLAKPIQDAITIYKEIWKRIKDQDVDEMEIHARNLS